MDLRDRLIRCLADGELHSGSAIAAQLGVTRSAVWKQVHRLDELSLQVQSAGRRGYRLESPLELLDRDVIFRHLDDQTRGSCEDLDVSGVTVSTSDRMQKLPAPAVGMWRGALAEFQTGGRGRRGRRWLSPYGSGLCLSVSWSFRGAPRDLPALSLAVGIAVRRALSAAGAAGLALKWPNDILLDGAKLGGILVDVDGDSRGPLRAVVGVGLNLSVPSSLAQAVFEDGGLRPAGVAPAMPDRDIGRNGIAARVFQALFRMLCDFSRQGFAPLVAEWQEHDYLRGRKVTVRNGSEELSGVVRGIAPDGALLLERADGVATVFNGEITLREAP